MPQLDTSNWFLTFLCTWLIFMTLIVKIMKTELITKPKTLKNKMSLNQWTWPW